MRALAVLHLLILPRACSAFSMGYLANRVILREGSYESAVRRIHDVRPTLFPWSQTTGSALSSEVWDNSGRTACGVTLDTVPLDLAGLPSRGRLHILARFRDESSLIFDVGDCSPVVAIALRVRPALGGACIELRAQVFSFSDYGAALFLAVLSGMRGDIPLLVDAERRTADVELDAVAYAHKLRALSLPTSPHGRTPLPDVLHA